MTRPAGVRFRLTPRFAAVGLGLLVVASDFEFRRRDVNQATAGAIDAAVIVELGAYAALGAWLLLTVARAPGGYRRPAPLNALWALCLALAASALWAPSLPLASARGFQLLVSMGFIAAVAARVDRTGWHTIAHGFVVVVSIGVVLGVFYRRPPEFQLAGRFLWLYGHPVVAASMLTVSSLFCLGWWLDRRMARHWPGFVYPGLFAVHTAALFATETRGSLVGFVAGVALLGLLRRPKGQRRDLAVLGVLGVPPLIGLSLPLLAAVALRGESAGQLRSLNSRAGLWSEAWAAFAERPLIGQGYFSSRQLFLETIGLGGAHNAYIEIGLSAGIIGLVPFCLVFGGVIRKLRQLSDEPERPMLAAVFAAMAINGLTAQYLAQAGTAANLLFLFVVAWIAMLAAEPARAALAGRAQGHDPVADHATDPASEPVSAQRTV